MGLEAVMVCLDNSEHSRNADFLPTRLGAQGMAVNMLTMAKFQGHPESTVGLLAGAGPRVRVLSTLSRDEGRLMDAVKLIQPAQGLNLVGMLKTAQLALKHREKKNSKQKVVLFVGSPVKNTPAELAKLAKLLKKNGVGVDVVNFGAENQTNDNCDKLSTFVKKVRSRDNSRFVNVPPQASLPDYVFNICVTEGSVEEAEGAAAPVDAGAAAPSGGAGQFAEYGGVDPNLDPELAMAIRMSMEEANAAAASASAAETGDNEVGGGDADADADADAMQDDNVPAPEAQQQPSEPNFDSMTEDQMMAYAIQMSLADDNNAPVVPDGVPDSVPESPSTEQPPQQREQQEEPQQQQQQQQQQQPAEASQDQQLRENLQDPAFLSALVEGLPLEDGDVNIEDILRDLADEEKQNGGDKSGSSNGNGNAQ